MAETNSMGALEVQFSSTLSIKCSVCQAEFDVPTPQNITDSFQDWTKYIAQTAASKGWKTFKADKVICPHCDNEKASWIEIQKREYDARDVLIETADTSSPNWSAKLREKFKSK